jgi:sugar lactone lactonase YvrE
MWLIDDKGAKTLLVDETKFPNPISMLNDVAADPSGTAVYVTDMGARDKIRDAGGVLWPLSSPEAMAVPPIGRIYRVTLTGMVTEHIAPARDILVPNGVAPPKNGRMMVAEFFLGNIVEFKDGKTNVLATGYRGADGIEQDDAANIFVSSFTQGKVWKLDRDGKNEQVLLMDLGSGTSADFYLDLKERTLVLPNTAAGALILLPI